MRHSLAAALLIASVASAGAQSYQTALPLSPAERRALEARLSTILDFSQADEVSRFQLPSGRTITVLPYRMVRSGPRPCRGYRIDLEGQQSRMAVDGFRCKRRDGQAWAIAEPELVLAQEGPSDLRSRNEPDRRSRTTDEPLYADDLYSSPAAPPDPPPVPRPAPARAEETAEANTAPQADGRPQAEPQESEATTTIARPAEKENSDAPFASRVAAALGDDTQPASEPKPPPAARRSTSESRPVERFSTEPTRVVERVESKDEADFSDNDTVVAGLTDLDYLRADEPATPQRVEAAIGEFAVDERFALPVSADVLIARLDAAIERSETLPPCGDTSLNDLCAMAQD